MRTVAMYLPQYHRTKENDQWWGTGFTDWIFVKTAEQMFPEHNVAHIPLDNNYYDLLEKSTMQWQADLMKKYGVDGLCFYHYYFKNGKKILEKPAEKLLEWKDIDMSFCFSWANETWAKTWSNLVHPNVWTSKNLNNECIEGTGILLEQEYGDALQWREHFDYLLPFFRDRRYIKKDEKPVFLIYQPDDIPCIKEMVQCWNRLAMEAGLQGIYFILTNPKHDDTGVASAIMYQEPKRAVANRNFPIYETNGVKTFLYSDVWEEALEAYSKCDNIYYGGFVGFDSTFRHGKRGYVIHNQSPILFQNYLMELYAKNYVSGSEIVFLNAWNEWGEGMYLEPNEDTRYQYLEAIAYAQKNYQAYIPKYQAHIKERSKKDTINALRASNRMLNNWLTIKEKKLYLCDYLYDRGIKTVAIYGMGILGVRILEDLKSTNVSVKFAIDQNACQKQNIGIPVYTKEEKWSKVDAIIITPITEYDDIKKYCECGETNCVLRLDEILNEILETM